jgi:hypothetical protein
MSAHKNTQYVPVDYSHEVSRRLRNLSIVNNQYYSDCPFCHSEAKHKKFSYTPTKSKTGVYNCFKCSEKGTGYQLLEKLGYDFKNRDESFHIPITPTPKTTPTPKPVEQKTKVLIPFYDNYTSKFIIRDKEGREVYQKHLKDSHEIDKKKNKPKKIITYSHLVNDIRYKGKGDSNKPLFYGLESIKDNTDILFIVEGEKKREKIITAIEKIINVSDKIITSISATLGSDHRLDEYTLQVIKERKVKRVVLLPDLDHENDKGIIKGKQFVIENRSILLENGIESYILDFQRYLPTNINVFSGYDIEDAIKDSPEIIYKILEVCNSTENLMKLQTIYLLDTDGVLRFKSPYVTQTIIPENISKLFQTKTFILKSLQGTGKTEFLQLLRSLGVPILYISPRESLCRDASNRLNIINYQDIKTDKECSEHVKSIAVCINSLYKFHSIIKNIDKFAVCIDEVDHTFHDLINSPHIKVKNNKYHRNQIYQTVIDLIKKSKYTYLTSADIPKHTEDFLVNNGIDSYMFIENSYKDKRNYTNYNLEPEITGQLLERIKTGKKVSISTNSIPQSRELMKKIENIFPEKRILFIYQKKTSEIVEILQSKDFSLYDIVIFTPTIFTGIDFSCEFADDHFLYITNNSTVNHYQALQSCFRFRKAKNIHFYIKPIKGRKEENKDTIIEKALNRRDYFLLYGSLYSDIDKSMLETYSNIEAENNRSKNNLQSNFINLVLSRLHNKKQFNIYIPKVERTEAEIEEYKKQTKDIKIKIKKEEIEKVFESERILDRVRIEELENGFTYNSEEEIYSLTKTKYLDFTNLDETSEEFKEILSIDLNKLKTSAILTKALVMPIEQVIEIDQKNDTGFIGDDHFLTLNREGSKEILQTLIPEIDFSSKEILVNSLKDREITEIDKNRFTTLDSKTIDKLSLYFNFEIYTEEESEYRRVNRGSILMRAFFQKIGWKVNGKRIRIEGKRVYRYTINTEWLSRLFSFGEAIEPETEKESLNDIIEPFTVKKGLFD